MAGMAAAVRQTWYWWIFWQCAVVIWMTDIVCWLSSCYCMWRTRTFYEYCGHRYSFDLPIRKLNSRLFSPAFSLHPCENGVKKWRRRIWNRRYVTRPASFYAWNGNERWTTAQSTSGGNNSAYCRNEWWWQRARPTPAALLLKLWSWWKEALRNWNIWNWPILWLYAALFARANDNP